ncbi:metalloregulator ArsR/SmtB family transcription factor [Roseimicrobium sp. ORNL1]|uniref:ArsR/SmtB family transcription factor n=1 Tax=Roseimicrobium sp. ORNL1 TaxID=2711231 RepID=UPI0013E1DF9D|nr:metalloregulator ArsR/SmtB family transcription factor [Roseimicrobium sp. ORNL1]QIF04702.1 winged helix-turn-helix transcriptional regulator [Roseimicrobium sp. ORNL1]
MSDRLSNTFAALADPTRRAILARLASGEASVKELAQPFDMTPPAITKHLKVLERSGLIARSRDAQKRPCRLKAKPLKEAVDWLERYRELWEERLDRLDEYLQELQAQTQSQSQTKAHEQSSSDAHAQPSSTSKKKEEPSHESGKKHHR